MQRRLSRLFALVSSLAFCALVAVALLAMRVIAANHDAATVAGRADIAALEDAVELQRLLYQKGFIGAFFLTNDESWLEQLERERATFEGWLRGVTEKPQSAETARVMAQLVANYDRYDAQRHQAVAEWRHGDREGAVHTLVAYQERIAELRGIGEHLLRVHRDGIEARLRAADRAWRHALYGLGTVVLLALGGAAALGFFLARRIGEPLYELVLHAAAAGGTRVEVRGSDEIGALSSHVRRLASEIEQSSAELALQRATVVQAEKMSALGEMAAAVAHQVLNPLAGVKAAVQLLARNQPRPEVMETVTAVDREVRRVENMAQRLIGFSRPLQPRVKPIDVAELLARAREAAPAGQRVRIEESIDDGVTLRGDPELLHQVLVNLLTNATQAMPDGGVIELSAHPEDGYTAITVRDEGIGIAPEIASHLFAPFFTTRSEGHGLGLAFCRNVALAHGGSIEATANAPAAGATFTLRVPA